MIDGLYKNSQDRLWDRIARLIVPKAVTPNHVTWAGTFLVFGFSAFFIYHRNMALFAVLLALSELLDNIDGAVARIRGSASRYGAYLDAVTDRYKETVVLGAVAYVTNDWPVAFFAIAGSLITSYNKARAGMEMPISNAKWPDLFERLERLVVLIVGLLVSPFVSQTVIFGRSLLHSALVVISVFSVLSSFQRLARARVLLVASTVEPKGNP